MAEDMGIGGVGHAGDGVSALWRSAGGVSASGS